MLKLKYLFKNEELAHMILRNWKYATDDSNLLKYYRISSNAVYWCRNEDKTFFLRFAPAEEKPKNIILAELEFLKYLRDNGYSSVDTILSKGGNELEEIDTPWGIYYAVAFKEVSGKQIEQLPLTNDIIFGYGKALGELHKLSNKYKPVNNLRKNWKETMNWMENILLDYPEETTAQSELYMLKDYFLKLPTTKENFGLIHYDFETDNVFYDETSQNYSAIDFDDSMYHWYALDIEQAIDSMKENIPKDQIESSISQFIKGYRSEYDISDDMLKLLPIFRRYADLYGYIRILRSTKEKWNNEPEWMINLRFHLENLLTKRKSGFNKPI